MSHFSPFSNSFMYEDNVMNVIEFYTDYNQYPPYFRH